MSKNIVVLTGSPRKSIKFMEWDSVGEVAISEVDLPGDIHKTDGIAQSIKLADYI